MTTPNNSPTNGQVVLAPGGQSHDDRIPAATLARTRYISGRWYRLRGPYAIEIDPPPWWVPEHATEETDMQPTHTMKLEKLDDQDTDPTDVTPNDEPHRWFSVPTCKRHARTIEAVRLRESSKTFQSKPEPSYYPPKVEVIFGIDQFSRDAINGQFHAPREHFTGDEARAAIHELRRVEFINDRERDAMLERFSAMESEHAANLAEDSD